MTNLLWTSQSTNSPLSNMARMTTRARMVDQHLSYLVARLTYVELKFPIFLLMVGWLLAPAKLKVKTNTNSRTHIDH